MSPTAQNRGMPPAPPPPTIGLGSGSLFPQLTPGVRDGKPLPGSQAHDPYMNGSAYSDANQNAKRGRQEDPYTSSRGNRPPSPISVPFLEVEKLKCQDHTHQTTAGLFNLPNGLKLVLPARRLNLPLRNQWLLHKHTLRRYIPL